MQQLQVYHSHGNYHLEDIKNALKI
jgi:hypothetical protein